MTSQIAEKLLDEFRGTQKKNAQIIFTHNSKSDLIEFISQFPKLRCEKDWFLSGFCLLEINR